MVVGIDIEVDIVMAVAIEGEVEAVKDLKEAEVRIEKNIIHLGDIDHHIIKNIEVIEIEEGVAHLHLAPHHHLVVLLPQTTPAEIAEKMTRTKSLKYQSKYQTIIIITLFPIKI